MRHTTWINVQKTNIDSQYSEDQGVFFLTCYTVRNIFKEQILP